MSKGKLRTENNFSNRGLSMISDVRLSTGKGDSPVPKRLFKYRSFSNWTLSMLVDDVVHFSDPATFNDPLDTRPNLHADLDNAELEIVLFRLVKERTNAEMSSAARTIRYKGPKTRNHIRVSSDKAAEAVLEELRYYSTDPDLQVDDPTRFLLVRYIEDELLRLYTRGIFSLGERATCPLMWSHYGDQHRGICLGYSVPPSCKELYKIEYGGSRLVRASDLASMLDGRADASIRVNQAVLLRKAKPWSYEREWRLVGAQGTQDSPLELEEVIFGMRCEFPVVYAITSALAGRARPVRFYAIEEQRDKFLLNKRKVDLDELRARGPKRSLDVHELFSDVSNT